jgi:hypothetical protein
MPLLTRYTVRRSYRTPYRVLGRWRPTTPATPPARSMALPWAAQKPPTHGAGLLLVAARPRARRLAARPGDAAGLGGRPGARAGHPAPLAVGGCGRGAGLAVAALIRRLGCWRPRLAVIAALPGRRLLAPLRSRCALASARVESRNGEAAAGHRRPRESWCQTRQADDGSAPSLREGARHDRED